MYNDPYQRRLLGRLSSDRRFVIRRN